MFKINDDLSIYVTRGDAVAFNLSATTDNGEAYLFKPNDIVRINIMEKKGCDEVVFQKGFKVEEETETVEISLTGDETKIGDIISKPTDYWYEIELNPFTNPKTIIGYDDETGAKIFKLFPEGEDADGITEEDIPIVDTELDLASDRPVQNQAIAYAVTNVINEVNATVENTLNEVNTMVDGVREELQNIPNAENMANLQSQITENKNSISTNTTNISNLQTSLGTTNTNIANLTTRVEHIEGVELTAVNTTYDNSTSGLSATNVQDAIDKLLEAGLSVKIDNVKVNELNLTTKYTWGEEQALPYNFGNSGSAVFKDEIHLIGGVSYSDSGYSETQYHIKLENGSWVSVSTPPFTGERPRVFVLNNELYASPDLYYSQALYKFDESTKTWTSVTSYPYAFYDSRGVVWNDEIHIMGGNYEGTEKRKHYKYDGSTWTSATSLPYDFYRGNATVWNNNIHILGSHVNAKAHYCYNGSTWTSVSTLPANSLYDSGRAFADNKLYYSNGDSLYSFDGTNWNVETLNFNTNLRCVEVHNGHINYMGGSYDNGQTKHYKNQLMLMLA